MYNFYYVTSIGRRSLTTKMNNMKISIIKFIKVKISRIMVDLIFDKFPYCENSMLCGTVYIQCIIKIGKLIFGALNLFVIRFR